MERRRPQRVPPVARDGTVMLPFKSTLKIPDFDVTVRVGCSLAYEVTGEATLLLNLKLRPDGNYAVVSEALALGENLHAQEFDDSHENSIIRVKLARGTNCFRHDAIVSVSSQPDNHDIVATVPQ